MTPKFSIGQTVKLADGEISEVLAIHISKNAVVYTVSSVGLDLGLNKVVNGVKTVSEAEMEANEG